MNKESIEKNTIRPSFWLSTLWWAVAGLMLCMNLIVAFLVFDLVRMSSGRPLHSSQLFSLLKIASLIPVALLVGYVAVAQATMRIAFTEAWVTISHRFRSWEGPPDHIRYAYVVDGRAPLLVVRTKEPIFSRWQVSTSRKTRETTVHAFREVAPHGCWLDGRAAIKRSLMDLWPILVGGTAIAYLFELWFDA